MWNSAIQIDTDDDDDEDDSGLQVVQDLAQALVQIEQMVEEKYLNPPLGWCRFQEFFVTFKGMYYNSKSDVCHYLK